MLGREISLPVDLMYGTPYAIPNMCPVGYTEWIKSTTMENFQRARERMQQAAECQKRVYDRKAVTPNFQEGEWVLRLCKSRVANKLSVKYTGPYLVLQRVGEVNYKIQRNEKATPVVVHVNPLKRYFSHRMPENWMKKDAHSETEIPSREEQDDPCRPEVRRSTDSASSKQIRESRMGLCFM
jgi:hypothetical protein